MTHVTRTKSKLGRYLQAAIVFGSLTALAMGGCSSSDEKRRASKLAGGCSLNSDCASPNICAFERCHFPCKEDRDCDPDPLRCVLSEESGVFVCQLEDETTCEIDKDCPGDQTCGIDDECRDPCKIDDDCIGDQICAASNECASSLASKDTLDAEGNIVPDGGPAGGTGGTGGADVNGGSGATTPSDGGSGSGGVPAEPTAGDGTGAAGDTSLAGGPNGEGGAPNYPPAEYEERPDKPEPFDNGTSTSAVPVTTSANLYLAGADQDWLSYTAPDDGRAHIVSIHVDQEPNLSSNIQINAAADFEQILQTTNLGIGQTRDLYLTLGSGATALIKFARYNVANTKGMAFVTLSDTPENDSWEPNNTKDAAKTITLGQTVSGQVLNPWVAANDRPTDDWFAIELAVGTATFSVLSTPSLGRLEVEVLKPNAGTVPANAGTAPVVGGTATYNVTVATQGIHYFIVKPFSGISGISFNENPVPAYLTEQYSFTITQPGL